MPFIIVGRLLDCLTPNAPFSHWDTAFSYPLLDHWPLTEALPGNFCCLNVNAISFLTYESRKALKRRMRISKSCCCLTYSSVFMFWPFLNKLFLVEFLCLTLFEREQKQIILGSYGFTYLTFYTLLLRWMDNKTQTFLCQEKKILYKCNLM